jgi:hypothetical protein
VRGARLLLAVAGASLVCVASGAASDWLPHPAGASWTYEWTDSSYARVPTSERVTVAASGASAFTLAWTSENPSLQNRDGAVATTGTVRFEQTSTGLQNPDWAGSAPPASFPLLCPAAARCDNSLAATYYDVVWGSRAPVLPEPVTAGLTWTSSGGAGSGVTSVNRYLGLERITVPAFAGGVTAAKFRSAITQRGVSAAYGSGTRTTWWVWGVGPVKVVFAHAGAGSPVTTAVLTATSLAPQPLPSLARWFSPTSGKKLTYRWTNPRHFAAPVVERVTPTTAASGSVGLSVVAVSGPMSVHASYAYALRAGGLVNVSSTTRSETSAALPPLGPRSRPPARRGRFTTPFDLMDFGFNPIFPAYPRAGDTWSGARKGRDFATYGVTGTSRVLGVQTVKVPAGRFRALAVRSTLRQPGYPFGSGTRTSWFVPGRGLVKLVFRHRDGSVSTVALLR